MTHRCSVLPLPLPPTLITPLSHPTLQVRALLQANVLLPAPQNIKLFDPIVATWLAESHLVGPQSALSPIHD